MWTPGSAGLEAVNPEYSHDPDPNVMYVFEPTYTLLYDVPLNVTGKVNDVGAVHERATCALPAVPVTLVGIALARTSTPDVATTKEDATSAATTVTHARDGQNRCFTRCFRTYGTLKN
jgi:hypothetical protein